MILRPLLLAAATVVNPAASPAPAPTPLKVIVTVKSTAFCSAVRTMALPIGYVNKRNDDAFSAIDHSMVKFLADNRGTTSATTTAELAQLEASLDDDYGTYNPTNELTVIQMHRVVYDIEQNLALADKVMAQSWQDHPKGADANLDALRQRVQNLIDLQRALANQYMEFAAIYMDNRGRAATAANPGQFKALLRSVVYGEASALAAAANESDSEQLPQSDAHDTARSHNTTEIARELRLQENAFAREIATAGNTCGL